MTIQLEFPFAVLNDERAPTPRVAVSEPGSLAEVVEKQGLKWNALELLSRDLDFFFQL